MKNKKDWVASKFVYKNQKLIASRDENEVGKGSILIADIIARFYDDNISKYTNGILLDLGCGKVPLYKSYEKYVTDTVCVDWGGTFHKSMHLDIEWDITEKLPFEGERFDTIILSDVLEHIPEPETLWREMSRVLRQDGNLIMNVPFYYWLHERPHDYYRYTEFALRRFVEKSDMEVIKIESMGGAPEILADIVAKNLILLAPRIGTPLALLVQWFAAAFIKTGIGRSISIKTGKLFPLGYFLIARKP